MLEAIPVIPSTLYTAKNSGRDSDTLCNLFIVAFANEIYHISRASGGISIDLFILDRGRAVQSRRKRMRKKRVETDLARTVLPSIRTSLLFPPLFLSVPFLLRLLPVSFAGKEPGRHMFWLVIPPFHDISGFSRTHK